mmetsp:Transcript_38296/g.82604  ORF Transcript_38296/g.82604 Transcript_38296/m.82604 type:complete len:264 (-) Transcript_38296:234-1025(-)
MSSGVVTLMLVYSPSVNFTFSPRSSIKDTSSVTSRFSFSAFSKPFRSKSLRMTWGVCASQSSFRLGVAATKLSSTATACLMVALVGTASKAAPCSAASATTFSISSLVTNGRAASWMATMGAVILAKPFLTESCLSLPPVVNLSAHFVDPRFSKWSLKMCCHSSAQTMTISETSQSKKVSKECKAISRPINLMYCLGMLAPILLPTPAESSTTPTSLPLAAQATRMRCFLFLWFDQLDRVVANAATKQPATNEGGSWFSGTLW